MKIFQFSTAQLKMFMQANYRHVSSVTKSLANVDYIFTKNCRLG